MRPSSPEQRRANGLVDLARYTVDECDEWLAGIDERLTQFDDTLGVEIGADYSLESLRRLGHHILDLIPNRAAIGDDPTLDLVIDLAATYVGEVVTRLDPSFEHAFDHQLIDLNGWTLAQVRNASGRVLVPTTMITKAAIMREPDFLHDHVEWAIS